MTYNLHDLGSIQDLTFVLAQDRIADLRATAPSTVDAPVASAPERGRSHGVAARARDAVGRRLITLGGSLVADEGLRRRALHL
jgi:hypothetical protein